jgi:hypothetical protein
MHCPHYFRLSHSSRSPIPFDRTDRLVQRGFSSSSMVGINSETVGWMCIARFTTV